MSGTEVQQEQCWDVCSVVAPGARLWGEDTLVWDADTQLCVSQALRPGRGGDTPSWAQGGLTLMGLRCVSALHVPVFLIGE